MEKTPKKKISASLTPILVALLVIASFAIGSLWTKVSYLENGKAVLGSEKGTGEAQAKPSDPYTPVKAETLNLDPITGQDHVKGDKNAQLTWVEYSDLECPFCKRVHPDIQKAVDEYKGKIKWVYRHFPLDSIHPKADKEAEASECAAELGGNDAFWTYVDKLFEVTPSNNGLDLKQLPKIAGDIGLNQTKFQTCLDSGKYAAKVESQFKGGEKAGVTGTPGNFLLDNKGNAWVIPGAVPYTTIKQLIDKALAS